MGGLYSLNYSFNYSFNCSFNTTPLESNEEKDRKKWRELVRTGHSQAGYEEDREHGSEKRERILGNIMSGKKGSKNTHKTWGGESIKKTQ